MADAARLTSVEALVQFRASFAEFGETARLASLIAYRSLVQAVHEWPLSAPALLRAAIDHNSLEVPSLPPVTVKPQQISAVFAHLLHNAIEASNEAARVDVTAHRRNGAARTLAAR